MARSTEDVFGNRPSSDESTDPVRDAPESASAPEPKVEPVATKEPEQIAKPTEKVDDEVEQEHTPDDLDGLKKALAASRGDKRKARKQWQETERKLAELQGQLAVYKQQGIQPAAAPVATPEPKQPDLDDLNLFDPAAVKEFIRHEAERIADQRVERRPRWWYEQDKAATKERHPDFDEHFAEFKKAADANPALWEQVEAANSPGEFIYKTGKTLREMQGVESIDDLREKIRAEERVKIESELGVQRQPSNPQVQVSQAPARPQIPKSLASIPGRGLGASPTWRGPRQTEDIFGSR